MIEEFKKIKSNGETRFVLEFSDAGVTGSTSIASVEQSIGELQSRTEPSKPRNFVAKNAKMGGAGKMKDKSKTIPRKEKHKKPVAEGVSDLSYDAQSLITKLRRDVEEKRLQPTPQAVLTAARELAGDMDFAPQLLVKQVLGQGVAEGVAETMPLWDAQKVLNHYGADYFGTTFNKLYFYKNRKQFSIGLIRNDDLADAGSVNLSDLNAMVRKLRDMRNPMPYKEGVAEGFNGEYDDEAGMAQSNLLTTARAVQGLLDTIKDRDNLPEWAQEKIAKAEMMLVSVWDYLQSQKEMGNDPQVDMEEGRSYYDNRTGFSRGPRDDERHELDVPRQDPSEFRMYNLTIDGKPLNPQPIMGRSNLIKFGKQQAAAGVDLSNAMISLVDEGVEETDAYMESLSAKLEEKIAEDAKVDRQAKHITKSMMKAHPGMSKDDAESAAWAHIKHPKKNKK
jgi:hypothetical protein